MNVIEHLRKEEAARLLARRPIPDFRPGDTVRVNVKVKEGERERIQAYEGVCIARAKEGIDANFTVRKISFGEGVERVFPLLSPNIQSIEVKRRGVVRRAKLYYLRDRRGKSARIAERQMTSRVEGQIEQTEFDEPLEPAGQIRLAYPEEPRGGVHGMVAAVKKLQGLRGEAEGPHARSVLAAAVGLLPDVLDDDVRRSDAREIAVSLGEHLCPLMFSPDTEIARTARDGLTRLAAAVGAASVAGRDDRLAKVLRHLEVAVVVEISIGVQRGAANVRLTARDVLYAAVKRPGLANPVRLQVLLEDMGDEVVETLGEAKLGPQGNETFRSVISGDRDGLGAKLLTLLANGREVFRCRLTRPAERILVI